MQVIQNSLVVLQLGSLRCLMAMEQMIVRVTAHMWQEQLLGQLMVWHHKQLLFLFACSTARAQVALLESLQESIG